MDSISSCQLQVFTVILHTNTHPEVSDLYHIRHVAPLQVMYLWQKLLQNPLTADVRCCRLLLPHQVMPKVKL